VKIRNVLGLFDGISCGRLALERAGIEFDNYYSSEIDKYALQISDKNYPDNIQLGDILNWREWDLENVDLIMGGSPCQGFSIAGNKLNFDDERSRLFFDFVDVVKHYKPKYFLLENVRMRKDIQDAISTILGVQPILINSGLVSAQSRDRLYWTNIPDITQPEDKDIYLKDIVETHLETIKGGNLVDYFNDKEGKLSTRGLCHIGTAEIKAIESLKRVYHIDGKSPTLTTSMGGHREAKIATSETTWRKLTPLECERLQTLPDNFTEGVSNSRRYKAIGNGWTVDVISHIFKNMEEAA
jgi:site-specific DNA-cytosine methylase